MSVVSSYEKFSNHQTADRVHRQSVPTIEEVKEPSVMVRLHKTPDYEQCHNYNKSTSLIPCLMLGPILVPNNWYAKYSKLVIPEIAFAPMNST